MYFNFHSVACAITALLTFQAAAVPISVNPLAQGASVESPAGDVRTYYQAGDGSIIEVTPNFPASSGYVSKVLIPAGVARLNTPLAAISWGAFDEVNFLSPIPIPLLSSHLHPSLPPFPTHQSINR